MIKGKAVAITGASSGVGKATALELGRLGTKLVLVARHGEPLERLAEEIRAAGGQAVHQTTDLSKREPKVLVWFG